MDRSSTARKLIGPIVIIGAIGIMIAFSIAGIVNPVLYYTPAKLTQVSMLNTPGSRKVFTTFFYWYQSEGANYSSPLQQHCVEPWNTTAYSSKIPSNALQYPSGWPGPTNPADMVQNVSSTTGWHDSLTYHPPARAPTYYANGNVILSSLKNGTMGNLGTWISFTNESWYQWELRCMMQAGIDVLMPDYWWNGVQNQWAIQGIPVLVKGWYDLATQLLSEGQATNLTDAYQKMPKICLFFDTTCMKQLWAYNMSKNETLTGDQGDSWYMNNGSGPNLNELYWQEKFWQSIDDFLNIITQGNASCDFLWNNRFIVWLYSASWFSDIGTTVLQYCRTQCMQKYNHSIYFVGGDDWSKAGVDGICPWGSSFGAKYPASTGTIPIGAVSPGFYDLGAIAGEGPLYAARDPSRYISEWQGLMNAGAAWIHVETWNEMHEGTGVAWTQEYGFKWIDLTRQMADIFHSMTGYDPYTGFNVLATIATLGALIVMIGVAGIATRSGRL